MLDKIAAVELVNHYRNTQLFDDGDHTITSVNNCATDYCVCYCTMATDTIDVFSDETIAYAYCLLIGAIK